MNGFLIWPILPVAVGIGEDTFWMQMLVFVVLAAVWGVYNLIKKKTATNKLAAKAQQVHKPRFHIPDNTKSRDLHSGMELLELDFVLSVVENTKSSAAKDVTMRKLNFDELARRGKLSRVKGSILTIYAVNKDSLYGKDRQCKAMKELARRTPANLHFEELKTTKHNEPETRILHARLV